jgi:hypothetical protein
MASSYNAAQAFTVPRHIRHKDGINIETLAADKALTYSDSQYQILTNSKGSAADVRMPAKKNGAMFWIKNQAGSGHALFIQEEDTTPIIGSPGLAAGKLCCVVCDGSSWAVLFQQA